MLHRFKKNLPRLPDNQIFSSRLEILSPLLYPGHGLVGLNHRAAVDAQQLRLVTMAFEDRCKPLSDREPQQLLYQRRQTTIDDWVVSHKAKYDSTSTAPARGPRHSGWPRREYAVAL